MYTKITRSGGRQYLQLVEGYRNEEGRVRHRVVANLGRLEDLTAARLDPLINGLNRAIGRSDNTAFSVEIESSRAYGNVFALHELWRDLGFDRAPGRAMRSGRRKIDVGALVRAMVVYQRPWALTGSLASAVTPDAADAQAAVILQGR